MKVFKNKVAVITGGASGIGLAIANRCVKEGMKIVLADIEESALKKAESQLKNEKADVLAVVTDVSKEKDIQSLANKTLDAYGSVDLLFNNAGVGAGSLLWSGKDLKKETFKFTWINEFFLKLGIKANIHSKTQSKNFRG